MYFAVFENNKITIALKKIEKNKINFLVVLSKKNKKHTRKNKSRKSRGQSPWIKHVKSVAKSQNISYREALKVAAKSFKK